MVQIFRLPALVLVFMAAFFGIARAEEPMRLDPHPEMLMIERQGSDGPVASYTIEIADTNEKRSRGLMHRDDLPLDRAMLFVFEGESMRAFWMANTPTPLDIIFADSEGRVTHVARDTVPFSRAVISSGVPASYALEVHAGQAGEAGIRPGDLMVHPVIGD